MWFKRIFLFIVLNLLVTLTISALLGVLGINPYLSAHGIDYAQLAVFCLIWGMGGAFISLALSRVMAKWMMGVHVIDTQSTDRDERWLLDTVHRLARDAGMNTMPEVGIYNSPQPNAFATGPSRSRSLVAVSTGLLRSMDAREVEGVLGHEISHITNGDMVTMTLLQGVVNAFVMFLSRVIAFAIAQALRGDRSRNGGVSDMSFFLIRFVLEIFFMILGSMVVAAFSRYREYRADAGGARLAGKENMIGALKALQRSIEIPDPHAAPAFQNLKISSGRRGGLMGLFMSHPPLEERIARLEAAI